VAEQTRIHLDKIFNTEKKMKRIPSFFLLFATVMTAFSQATAPTTLEGWASRLQLFGKKVPQEQSYSTHDNTMRNVPQTTDEDFKPLEERLPGWIATTLEEAKGDNNDD